MFMSYKVIMETNSEQIKQLRRNNFYTFYITFNITNTVTNNVYDFELQRLGIPKNIIKNKKSNNMYRINKDDYPDEQILFKIISDKGFVYGN